MKIYIFFIEVIFGLMLFTQSASAGGKDVGIEEVIKWYKSPLGIDIKPNDTYIETISDRDRSGAIRSEGILYDGVPMGWANHYYKGGAFSFKNFFDNEGNPVKGKRFDNLYYQGDTYTMFGDGENFPLAWLKNGKPYNGKLTLGKYDKDKDNGSLSTPYDDKSTMFRFYVKNGFASGLSYREYGWVKGKFKNG